MQTWDHEAASIYERENARAVQRAVNQIAADMPNVEVTEAILHSRIVPLPNESLRIKGPRWYVRASIQDRSNGSSAQALYRVWQTQEGLNAAQVTGEQSS